MSKHLRYCMMESRFNCNEIRHPQKVMLDLGITYQHATPQSIGDQWWFWNCENIPDTVPPFITEMINDPMKCVGFGLDQESAEKIRDYKSL